MYRIELAPGEETVFRTFEELATGVRNGFITPRARIYHAASQKWLPIEFHPHYKKALENPARGVEPPTAKPGDRARGASAASAPGLFGSAAPASAAPAPTAPAPGTATTAAPASDPSTRGSTAPSTPAPGRSTRASMTPDEVTPPSSLHAESSAPASRTPATSERTASGHRPGAFAPLAPSLVVATSHRAAFAPPMAAPMSVARSPLSVAGGGALALLSASVIETATEDASVPEASVIHLRGVETPTAAEDASVEEPVFPRPMAASQPLELPRISYPEIMPAEEPVAHRPRTMGGSRRTLQLGGVAVLLVACTYAAVSVFSARRGDSATAVPVETVADRPAMPAQSPATSRSTGAPARTPASVSASATSGASSPAPAPARLNPSQPASSGFAPALEPRALVSTAPAKPAAAGMPAASVDSSLAPPPVALDLDVPALPGADSVVVAPRQHSDSAMKRILRAVSGGKDIPAQR